ncbi:nitrate ABC transporter ATP-binding protein [Rhodoplanes roseus]|uniref:Nitrate ABC transporter ATP-binding protein n=2 Tax=Rhodoplanes roseus TaxID=29409 RepID=A0A327KXY3_9BRAD|nr:ABC transporter ATP-binding protein [Rhodoplanes roseus]RAI43131.1 nitrate ABC transporter ATP-binding protein [Rhodoplanes roseus]
MRGVRLAFGRRNVTVAVENLDLAVRKDEFVAVVGPSGCGKSTLMKLMTGLVMPNAGTIAVNGQTVTGPLSFVGMAFQNPTLLPWRRTLANVMLPLEIVEPHRRRFRRERAAYAEQARALLKTVGLGGFADKYPWQLSGGMQQRASLCRALIHGPSLLMLDEPFGALDAFTREELWDVLQAIRARRAFTTVLVTHDLREAVYLADTVHVMSARPGRIIASYTVPFRRPRTLKSTFEPAFADLVQRIRDDIHTEREADAVAVGDDEGAA